MGTPSPETDAPILTFVHIPRTGGIWVHELLRYLEIPFAYNGHEPLTKPTPRSFTVTRDPQSWLRSWYNLVKGMGKGRRQVTPCCAPLMALDYASFDCFRDSYERICPCFLFDLYASLGPACEKILDQVSLREDMIAMLRGWGYEFDPEVVRSFSARNVSRAL